MKDYDPILLDIPQHSLKVNVLIVILEHLHLVD